MCCVLTESMTTFCRDTALGLAGCQHWGELGKGYRGLPYCFS
jgi:hypothetical protein